MRKRLSFSSRNRLSHEPALFGVVPQETPSVGRSPELPREVLFEAEDSAAHDPLSRPEMDRGTLRRIVQENAGRHEPQPEAAKRILDVPRNLLMPVILLFCIVGAFAINNTPFDIGVMLVAGVAAYVLEENGFPVSPAILGVVLGGMLEENFITSMIKSDSRFVAFFERPIAAALGAATLALWAWPLVRFVCARRPAVAG